MTLSLVFVCTLLVGAVWAEEDTRVYTFGVNSAMPPYEMVSSEGRQEGFGVEVIKEICKVAGKQCEMVTYQDTVQCWSNTEKRANALDNKYWDACGTWYPTQERMLVYYFPPPFVGGAESYLYVLAESRMGTYDPARHRTGFREDFWTNPSCMKDNNLGVVQRVVNYDSFEAIAQALTIGQIGAAFGDSRVVKDVTKPVRKIAGPFMCGPDALSLIVRKEEKNNFAWWKPAVDKVIKGNFYKFLCAHAEALYGYPVNCLD